MLKEYIDGLSDFLLMNRAIIPNVITLIIMTIVIILSLKGGAEWYSLVLIYLLVGTILEVLGIESVFNIITLISNVIDELIDLVFLKVV